MGDVLFSKVVLTKAVQVIVFLFAAFGGFLAKMAPPEDATAPFAVGISSFLALCVLLFVSAVSKNLPTEQFKKRWLLASGICFMGSLIATPFYLYNFDRLTFTLPPEAPTTRHVRGTEWTALGQRLRHDHPYLSVSKLVDQSGGRVIIDEMWTPESIRLSRLILTGNYILLVLSIATTVACLTEGILRDGKALAAGEAKDTGGFSA